jgi:glycerol 3-phosphatase-2
VTVRRGLLGSEKALASSYDVALLDLDGVVYIGGTAIPGAPEALRKAKAEGIRLAYVTNNASRTPAAVAAGRHERARHHAGRGDVRSGRRPAAG